jgi:glycosyltransferase involved in cell wall biosynthesis
MMRLSVAIPVYNEEDVVPELLARVLAVLDALPGGPHEVVFADDGSTDGTRRILTEAARRDARIKVVVLSRNFGHQAAFGAALDHTTGNHPRPGSRA